jgi:hypothetical protein
MSRKPRKATSRRKPIKRASRAHKTKPDPLDAFIASAATALGLQIDRTWLPAVRGNVEVTLRHGARVASFALPDETEPAPVFQA